MPYPRQQTTAPGAGADFAAQAPHWWQRKPTPLAVAIGAAAALALAILVGLLMTPSMQRSDGEDLSKGPRSAVRDDLIQFHLQPARGPYQPPSASRVDEAYLAVEAAFRAGGVSELARQGLLCFRALEASPSYGLLDYCVAFDEFATALATRVAQGQQPSPASWLGSTGARHLNAAHAIMGEQGDADARLLDLRRMADRRAAEPGPAVAQQAAASAAPQDAAEAARPPPRATIAPHTLQPGPPLPAAGERDAALMGQELGARQALAAGPSFNCRYARTRSEQMVCADPGLAAADRRLERAYRDAIRAGTPERTLRAAQDRWLWTRERNVSDNASLAAVYERRIEELQALAR